MTPETEIIACPACKHLVRLPLDWLGTEVQCPECKSKFRAPVRIDGKLTEAELLSRGDSEAESVKPRGKVDYVLLIPAFGLLLCGLAGTLVNGVLWYRLLADPVGVNEWMKQQIEATKGFAPPQQAENPEKQAAIDEQNAAQLLKVYRWLFPIFFCVSFGVLCGGLAMVLRRGYRVSQFACVLAMLNFAHLCCLPGAVFGIWGLLMLSSSEAREHFNRG